MADLTGQTLGQYTLGELIGKGGMATVYRARQESMGRDVAIKVMATELSDNEEFVARFEREARVIARLQHPHILPVIDFGRSGNLVYLVMRLVEVGTLSQRLRSGTLTLQQVNQFLTQIASALEYAHQHGVVHRDLKPNNILLDDQDNTYLTDFGIAKMLANTTSLNLTATGHVMGTPAYMAPEQWRSEPVDARTDIYALGVILYEMLIGALPFQAETPFGMMYKHFDTSPPLPRLINPRLPAGIEEVLLRALAKAPADRYPSARQMASDFNRVVQALPPDMLAAPLPRATPDDIARATPSTASLPPAPPPIPPTRAGATAPSGGVPFPIEPTWLETPASARGSSLHGMLVWGVVAAAIVAALVVAGLIFMNSRDGNNPPGDTVPPIAASDADRTGTAVALLLPITQEATDELIAAETPAAPTHTPDSSTTVGPTETEKVQPPTATPSSTDTPSPTMTDTSEPTATDTPEPTATHTDTPAPSDTPRPTATDTPRPTSTDTATPSETPDLGATADALLAIRLSQTADSMTLTAESWTPTPIPTIDVEATVKAALTGTASAWTDTPTPTPSPSATDTPTPTRTPTRTPAPSPTSSLCGGVAARMRPNSGGRTTLVPDTPTRIRRAPSLSASVTRSIMPGQTFWVLRGPQCADNVLWYEIEGVDVNGTWTGWIGEGASGTYWIEPFETGPIDCPGAPPPRMTVGGSGRITLYPPLPSRVRSSPSTHSSVLGQLQPGTTFKVISGPVCDTEMLWRWWLIESSLYQGWVAEGPLGEYYIEPM